MAPPQENPGSATDEAEKFLNLNYEKYQNIKELKKDRQMETIKQGPKMLNFGVSKPRGASPGHPSPDLRLDGKTKVVVSYHPSQHNRPGPQGPLDKRVFLPICVQFTADSMPRNRVFPQYIIDEFIEFDDKKLHSKRIQFTDLFSLKLV